MTTFLGFALLCVLVTIYDRGDKWWKIVPLVALSLAIAGLMMLSHWGWTP